MKFLGKCKDSQGNVMDLYEHDGKTYRENAVNPPIQNPKGERVVGVFHTDGNLVLFADEKDAIKYINKQELLRPGSIERAHPYTLNSKVYLWTSKKPLPPGKMKARVMHYHGKGHHHRHKGTVAHHNPELDLGHGKLTYDVMITAKEGLPDGIAVVDVPGRGERELVYYARIDGKLVAFKGTRKELKEMFSTLAANITYTDEEKMLLSKAVERYMDNVDDEDEMEKYEKLLDSVS